MKRMLRTVTAVTALATMAAAGTLSASAAVQDRPARAPESHVAPATHAPAARLGMQPVANLRQLMIGMLYPESNVVFAAQGDLTSFKQAEDAASSPNPLTSIYPGWQAVQDAAISLEDSANLLLLPGRVCSNGKLVPLNRPDWGQFVQIMRSAAQATYKAAVAKSQDDMVTASYTLTIACNACHLAYRDKYPKQGATKVCTP